MRSSSLPKTRNIRNRDGSRSPVPVTPTADNEPGADVDPLIVFEGWYRARTEPARTAAGWSPQSTLHTDYLKFAATVAPDEQAMDEPAFRDALAGTHAQTAKRMVQLFDSSREELKDCWSRSLMRPIRVAA